MDESIAQVYADVYSDVVAVDGEHTACLTRTGSGWDIYENDDYQFTLRGVRGRDHLLRFARAEIARRSSMHEGTSDD